MLLKDNKWISSFHVLCCFYKLSGNEITFFLFEEQSTSIECLFIRTNWDSLATLFWINSSVNWIIALFSKSSITRVHNTEPDLRGTAVHILFACTSCRLDVSQRIHCKLDPGHSWKLFHLRLRFTSWTNMNDSNKITCYDGVCPVAKYAKHIIWVNGFTFFNFVIKALWCP